MRYAILSDIHANLEAFRAVMDVLSSERIDRYLSVGDVVGYGADPKECIALLRSLEPEALVAGNHEWGVLGRTEKESFNELARYAVLWTAKTLLPDEIEYLNSFRLVYEDDGISIVHGTLNMPEEFYYIFDVEDACVTISKMNTNLCLVGHTHIPAIFVSDGAKVEYIESSQIRIDPEKKYVINTGSIGQPRDGDPRASFGIYDSEESIFEIRRVSYDVQKAAQKILRSGLPARLADRLKEGR